MTATSTAAAVGDVLEAMLGDVTEGRPAGPGVVAARARGWGAPLDALGPGHLVLPTSGSTSAPRLVVRTVTSWTDSFDAFTRVAGLTGPQVVWAPGPASSTMTLFAAWHARAAGWGLRNDGPWRGLPAGDLDDVTCLHAVPIVTGEVLEAATLGRLPNLRTVVVAGAHAPARLRTLAAVCGVRLVEYYGAAELSFVAVDPDGRGLVPFPRVEVRAVEGRLQVRSPWVCRGYLADVPGPLERDDEGWAGVGDRGTWDGAHLTVQGRGGGAVVGGVTVHLADVESALRAVPGVADVASLAVPSPHLGEVVAVLVEPRPEASPGLRESLLRAAAEHLVPAARPRIVMIGALPRTPSGKVDRARLAALVTS